MTINEPVLLRRDEGQIAILTLNRPHAMNALSHELVDALKAQFDELANNREIRCVIIEARGRIFSSGHDINEILDMRSKDRDERVDSVAHCSAMMLSISRLPQPVIAKVHGMATAAGCELVASCDLVVASTEATFATSGIRHGLFCGTPSVPVGRNVGKKRALDMLLTGQPIDATTALRDGLVSRVVAPDMLDQETMSLANQIAQNPPEQIASGKAMFNKHIEMDIEQAYATANGFMADAVTGKDAQIGFDAFINKKAKPEWSQR